MAYCRISLHMNIKGGNKLDGVRLMRYRLSAAVDRALVSVQIQVQLIQRGTLTVRPTDRPGYRAARWLGLKVILYNVLE